VELGPPGQERAPDGPRLTLDDLIEFHMLLQTDGWFEALMREVNA
jgi:hypothetical protein